MTTPRNANQHNLLMMINTAMTGAVLLYVVNTEHRITALETKLTIVAEFQRHAPPRVADLTSGKQKP